MNIHVNLVDLTTPEGEIQIFKSSEELSAYTRKTKKIFSRRTLCAGELLQHLLRHIFNPRLDVDKDRRGAEIMKKLESKAKDKTFCEDGRRRRRFAPYWSVWSQNLGFISSFYILLIFFRFFLFFWSRPRWTPITLRHIISWVFMIYTHILYSYNYYGLSYKVADADTEMPGLPETCQWCHHGSPTLPDFGPWTLETTYTWSMTCWTCFIIFFQAFGVQHCRINR